MKRHNHAKYWFAFIAAVLLIFTIAQQTEAAEHGGAIQTKGQITFLEDSSSSSTSSSSSSDSSNPSSSSSTSDSQPSKSSTKPKGRFPSTGELVKRGLSTSGLLLLLIVLSLYLWKYKKQADQKRGN